MKTAGQPLRVAVYCRISDDREGERLGVQRQRDDCMARAERETWRVIEVFTDNDISASTRSRKPRPAYQAMIKRVQAGEVDVILSYSASRLTRRPRELLDLIELHDTTGVLLRTIVSTDVDLSTADGRALAITLAAWDAAEAERAGERIARAARQRRDAGLRHGGFPPYGYRNADGGRLTVDPERAEVVREAARRILAGESLYGVWTDFNRRGIKTAPSPKALPRFVDWEDGVQGPQFPGGARWHARTLKRVLTEPTTIGCMRADDGSLRQVADPLVDRATWDRLREILYAPGRFDETRKPDWSNRRKFALSGLFVCGLCGATMSGSSRGRTKLASGEKQPRVKTFTCATATGGCGKLRIDYAAVETWVLGQLFARLDRVPGVETALSTVEQRADDDELRQAIRDDERQLERLDDEFADGVLDRTRYRRQVERITTRIDGNRSKLAEVMQPAFVIDTNGRTVRDAWAERADDATWQRTLLGHVLYAVVIKPHPAGVTSTVTRRRDESASDFDKRRTEHRELVLMQRVHPKWKV